MTIFNSVKKHLSSPHSSASPLPDFLAIPLSSPDVFQSIARTLSEREQGRMLLSAQANTSRRARLTPRSSNGSSSPQMNADGADVKSASPPKFCMSMGQSDLHRRKNRYGDIVAYDATRVLLPPEGDQTTEEYVNASLLVEPDLGVEVPRSWWIAAQAPVASTVHAFLSLLLTPPTSHATSSLPTFNIPKTIIQLTPLVENGREKATPYFGATIGETVEVAGPVGRRRIWVKLCKKDELEGRRVSSLEVGTMEGEKREAGRPVTHVEYLGWGDHGVPDDPEHLVNFIKYTNSLDPGLKIVHCSAGVGRTGTYITISSLLPLLAKLFQSPPASNSSLPPLPPPLPDHPLGPYPADSFGRANLQRDFVGLTVDGLREQRCTMVQNVAQLKWCYEALRVAWKLEDVKR